MGEKRKLVNGKHNKSTKKQDKRSLRTNSNSKQTVINEYDGYKPLSSDIELDTIQFTEIKSDEFYHNYIKPRKPVIINGIIPGIDLEKFQPENIVGTLGSSDLLLVEKKFKGGFGSGTERIKKTFGEFMELLHGKDADDYYLTTQYAEDDPDDIHELFEGKNEEGDDADDYDEEEQSTGFDEIKDEESSDEESEEVLGDFKNSASSIGNSQNFSDADSIDFNDIHDDFQESSDDEEIISTTVPGEPLTIDESARRVHELVQKPLTNLLKTKSLPLEPEIMNKLIPQQINIWIGSAKLHNEKEFKLKKNREDLGLGRRIFGGGASSGLHHDHADNLYLPLKGHKRFTIFAPSDAEKMYTVGKINHVFKSGVIDYTNDDNAPGWRRLRGDSAIITEVAKWRLDNEDDLSPKERDALITLVEEEEKVLKGFETKVFDSDKVKKDPPSFSTIPASIVHLDQISDSTLRSKLLEYAKSKWPKFFKAKRITANLKPGQMFYLPAGWFHEVTSFGDNNNSRVHVALNYWYSPPDDEQNVYQDSYWADDYKRTSESCKYFESH